MNGVSCLQKVVVMEDISSFVYNQERSGQQVKEMRERVDGEGRAGWREGQWPSLFNIRDMRMQGYQVGRVGRLVIYYCIQKSLRVNIEDISSNLSLSNGNSLNRNHNNFYSYSFLISCPCSNLVLTFLPRLYLMVGLIMRISAILQQACSRRQLQGIRPSMNLYTLDMQCSAIGECGSNAYLTLQISIIEDTSSCGLFIVFCSLSVRSGLLVENILYPLLISPIISGLQCVVIMRIRMQIRMRIQQQQQQPTRMNIKDRNMPALQEFEWFLVQTRVRQIIAQLMSPLQSRVHSALSSVTHLTQITTAHDQKIKNIISIIDDDPQVFQKGIFTRVTSIFQQQQHKILQIQAKADKQGVYMGEIMKGVQSRMKEVNDELKNIVQFKIDVRNEMSIQQACIRESTTNLSQSVNLLSEEILGVNQKIDQISDKLGADMKVCSQGITSLSQITSKFESNHTSMTELCKQIALTQKKQELALEEAGKEIGKIAKWEQISKRVQAEIERLRGQILKLVFKVQVNTPIINITHMNEFLYKVLPQKYHLKIALQYQRKYMGLSKELLSKEFGEGQGQTHKSQNKSQNLNQATTIRKTVGETTAMMKSVHERTVKLIFKTKKNQLSRQGIDFQHLSHQKREQLLENIVIGEGDVEDEGEEEDNIKKKKGGLDVQQIKQIMNSQIKSKEQHLTSHIDMHMNDSRQYIYGMEQQLLLLIAPLEKQIAQLQQSLSDNTISINLNSTHVNALISHSQQQINQLSSYFNKYTKQISTILSKFISVGQGQGPIQQQHLQQIREMIEYMQTGNKSERGRKPLPSIQEGGQSVEFVPIHASVSMLHVPHSQPNLRYTSSRQKVRSSSFNSNAISHSHTNSNSNGKTQEIGNENAYLNQLMRKTSQQLWTRSKQRRSNSRDIQSEQWTKSFNQVKNTYKNYLA